MEYETSSILISRSVLAMFYILLSTIANLQPVIGIRTFQDDSFKSPAELIRSRGYPCEEYSTITKDGYILTLQRIPHGIQQQQQQQQDLKEAPHRTPVLLVHGLFSSATEWVINFPHQSLGFILADVGYDVWLGNFRGTPYANKHITKRENSREYWNYGVDEVALFDIPRLVDFVLAASGFDSLFYAGFSQGNMAAFAMLADLPEYNHKIRLMAALAPVCNMTYIRTPLRVLYPVPHLLRLGYNPILQGALLKTTPLRKDLTNVFCEAPWRYLCGIPTFISFGVSRSQLNQTRLPVYLSHIPSGASMKNVAQFGQFIRASNFRHFDYGTQGNLEKYGTPTPPKYDTLKITTPIALLYSKGDYFGNPDDVTVLKQSLRSVIWDYQVPSDDFVHLDFVLGLGARKLVYDPLIELMDKIRHQ